LNIRQSFVKIFRMLNYDTFYLCFLLIYWNISQRVWVKLINCDFFLKFAFQDTNPLKCSNKKCPSS
jgi:hypothetical protein